MSIKLVNSLHGKCMFMCIRNLISVCKMQVYLHAVKYNTRAIEHKYTIRRAYGLYSVERAAQKEKQLLLNKCANKCD